MKKWVESLYLSLFNNAQGFAGRKLTAAVLTVLVALGDFIYFRTTEATFISVFIEWLWVHLTAIGFFLGLVAISNLVELRTGMKSTTTTEESKKTETKTVVEGDGKS